MKIEDVAKVCHCVNKAFCESIGDHSQVDWNDAPEWQKYSAIDGVVFHLKNQNSKPEDSHNKWLKTKFNDGWKYGPVKNAETKEHPSCVPYDELPVTERTKDYLFQAVCHSLSNHVTDYWENM